MSLRVLMFGWEFPPHNSGGLGTACEGLTRALARQGVETIFVLPKRVAVAGTSAVKIVFAEIDKVLFKRVPALLYPYVTSGEYSKILAGAGSTLYSGNLIDEVRAYALRSRSIITDYPFDIIHAHDWLSFPAGIMAKRLTGKPLVVHVHATEFDRGGGNGVNQQVYAIEKEGMEVADGIVAVSQWTKNLIIKHYGIAPDKIHVVHNGVEAEEYPILSSGLQALKRAGSNIVLFVGRITLQKGPDYFIKVAKRVLEYAPKTYFVMVGSGDMMGQVISAAASLGISDRVIFPGFLRGEELHRIYQAADVYVLPSVSEPFGITPLESLANGTPVIVSKQSGVAEVLNHALKVDFWDIDEMTNQILSIFRHQALKHTLATEGKREVGRLSWSVAAEKCRNLYRRFVPQA